MNGPGHTPPRRPSRATVITIRVVVVVLTVCTVGVLCWVPVLRLAIMRRRAQDWALFWAVLAASVGLFSLMRKSLSGTGWDDAGLAGLMLLAAATLTLYIRTDVRIQREAGAGPAGHAHSQQPRDPYVHQQLTQPQYMMPPQPMAAPRNMDEPRYAAPQPPPPRRPRHARPRPTPESAQAVTMDQAPPGPRQPGPPQPPPRPHRPQRIDQVRAELDELSDLLRREPRDRREHER
ncbi:hypothetical protein ACH427_16550 [Streptomyces sp. NPDC020379]|uniref:hypothetical protein n=1 Tax=Streptomyces sp. NPDC020379 TaxID=3365071 RepID=UPI0037A71ABB